MKAAPCVRVPGSAANRPPGVTRSLNSVAEATVTPASVTARRGWESVCGRGSWGDISPEGMPMPAPHVYDALLLVSFGGPEGPDDVIPFLENVLRGKPVPRERLLEVAEHYQHFGGVSPINQAVPGPHRGPRTGVETGRRGPAGLLGQPQLGADAAGHRPPR